MIDLFNTMRVFAPNQSRTIVDIEIEPTVDFIKADLIVLTDGEDATCIMPFNIRHAEFEKWLTKNERFEVVSNKANHKGEHEQTVYEIDYMAYLNTALCDQDVYDFLRDTGRINMPYDKSLI